MAVLLPQVTSLVAVALIFTQLFAHDYGFVNYVLGLVGIHHVYWEAGRFSSWVALSVMVTWRWTGYNALIYLAAMQSIPEELYEAAAVDGARRWRQFLHVTVPMLRPTIIFTVIISTIGGLQLFTEPYLFQPTSERRHRRLGAPVPDDRDVPVREVPRQHAVQVRLRGGDRVVPLPADRRVRVHQLPASSAGSGRRRRRWTRVLGDSAPPAPPPARSRGASTAPAR